MEGANGRVLYEIKVDAGRYWQDHRPPGPGDQGHPRGGQGLRRCGTARRSWWNWSNDRRLAGTIWWPWPRSSARRATGAEVKAASLTDGLERFGDLRTVTAWKDGVRTAPDPGGLAGLAGLRHPGFCRDWRSIERRRTLTRCPDLRPPSERAESAARRVLSRRPRRSGGRDRSRRASGTGGIDHDDGGQRRLRGAGPRTAEVLLPAVAAVIVRVDLAAGVLVVRSSPGLLD